MSEENKNLNTTAPEAKTEAENKSAEVKTDDKKSADKKPAKAKKSGGLKAFMRSRKAKHGSMAVAIVAVVIVVTIVLNIICGLLVDRFPNLKLDLTANNAFELQDDTIEYMHNLENEVKLRILSTRTSFENNGTYFVQAATLLDKMESEADGKLKVTFEDVATDPNFANKYPDITWDGSVNNLMVVECGEQYKALTLEDCFGYDESYLSYYGSYSFTSTTIEQAVVTAILNVTTEDKVVVDMITGNGEQDYTAIKELLEKNAYQVNEVSLATAGLDDEAEIAFLFAPSVDLELSATEAISTWLDNGGKYGKTLVYVPCPDKAETPNIDELLADWGMQVNGGYVFETNQQYLVSNSSPYAFIVDYTDYYMENLKNSNIPVLTSDTHDIIITDENAAHSLLTTSTDAGVYPYDADENWNYKDAMKGEALNIAAEGTKTDGTEKDSRLIVFGSYMMFTESAMSINSFNNSAYLLNLVNTVADKDDVGITIESKSLDSGELGVTDMVAGNIVLIVFAFVIPIGILATGIIVWLRRRNR